jgi:hypothetical protein
VQEALEGTVQPRRNCGILAERLASEHSDRLTPETFFAEREVKPKAAQ